MNILESIGKALGIESLQNVVPSLKKAYELATQNGDKGFFEKISLFYTAYTEEMEKLDGEKKGITADTQDKVQATLRGAITLGEGNVVDQMKMRLNGRQKEMAYLIENLFTKRLKQFDRDLSDGAIRGIVGAALINANQESRFNPNATGDGGRGIGLFQVHPWGGSVAYRKVPENNINLILDKEVCTGRGKTLIRRAKAGADVAELTALFSKYIERPGDEKGEMEKRANVARNVFRGGIAPEPRAVASAVSPAPQAVAPSSEVSDGKNLRFQIDLGGIKKGFCDLANGQKTWFFGSSSVVGTPKSMGGRLGVTGINATEFLANLENTWWKKIETAGLKPPREVVITGLGQNSVSNDASVKKAITAYDGIRRFLAIRGVSVVKFITINPGRPKNVNVGVARANFNKKLKQKYGSDCIDVASGLTEDGGYRTKGEYSGGDGIHLNPAGKKIWNQVVIAALNEGQKTA
ncbi:MAG: phage tail tip lysozyme [Candidatus Peregrinibacteria bacterium]|nr:phage tail tip lysozyme [Candidatus Peregrinibacteria bacterium]